MKKKKPVRVRAKGQTSVGKITKNITLPTTTVQKALDRIAVDPAAQLAGATKFTSLVRWLVMRYVAGAE